MELAPKAKRLNTEFAANDINAKIVNMIVRKAFNSGFSINDYSTLKRHCIADRIPI